MFKLFLLPAFLLLCLAQWFIPGQMIWKREKVLTRGKLYKFKTAPVDPVDPFRGRYIVLNFEEDNLVIRGTTPIKTGSTVYTVFQQGADGFASIRSISEKIPKQDDYLKTTVYYVDVRKDSSVISINYPFSKYYMEESKAPKAERIYSDRSRLRAQKTYALVSILDGDAVIRNVFVNDSSISDIIRYNNERTKNK